MSLKDQITEDMKSAMKAGEKDRLKVVRLMLAAIKQIEIDKRIELDDAAVLSVLDKMVKQRRESLEQYEQAGRTDLAEKEQFELGIIQTYLPEPIGADELETLIRNTIEKLGAGSIRDMGQVMNSLRGQVRGRADMKAVSQVVKDQLNS